jgi:hypothetical protein
MPKSRRRPPARGIKKIVTSPKSKDKVHSTSRVITEWTLGIATIVGAVVGLLIFLPRVTVEPAGQIDPSSPYPIPFTIINTGIIPLMNLQPAVGLCSVTLTMEKKPPQSPPDSCAGSLGTRFVMPQWFIRKLSMDERHVVRFDDVFDITEGVKLAAADISIIIQYDPWMLPIRREKEFHFATRFEKDGKLSWIPRPLEK